MKFNLRIMHKWRNIFIILLLFIIAIGMEAGDSTPVVISIQIAIAIIMTIITYNILGAENVWKTKATS